MNDELSEEEVSSIEGTRRVPPRIFAQAIKVFTSGRAHGASVAQGEWLRVPLIDEPTTHGMSALLQMSSRLENEVRGALVFRFMYFRTAAMAAAVERRFLDDLRLCESHLEISQEFIAALAECPMKVTGDRIGFDLNCVAEVLEASDAK